MSGLKSYPRKQGGGNGKRERETNKKMGAGHQRTTSWKQEEDWWTGQRVLGSENNIVEAGRRLVDRAACPGIREQHRGSRKKTGGQGSVSWDHPNRNVSQRYAELKKMIVYEDVCVATLRSTETREKYTN